MHHKPITSSQKQSGNVSQEACHRDASDFAFKIEFGVMRRRPHFGWLVVFSDVFRFAVAEQDAATTLRRMIAATCGRLMIMVAALCVGLSLLGRPLAFAIHANLENERTRTSNASSS
jgi:hypothetical protein